MKYPRVAGCTIPLFSIRTRRSWGIGEIPDMVACARWLATGGLRLLQILPPYELARGEASPYGARTAFGLDPIYISLDDVPDLDDAARGQALGADGARELARLQASERVEYDAVRALKDKVLRAAFDRFRARELAKDTERAKAFRDFTARAAAWEDDLALYVALREARNEYGWETWPDAEKRRDASALAAAKKAHEGRILLHQYAQWIAHLQWAAARKGMREAGVELMGDMPFIVGKESADVWSHQKDFRLDVSLGAPPDAFSEDGQDWGLPAYDFATMDANDLAWLRARTRHAAELYDRFRLDHVIGYFRQYVKPHGGKGKKGDFDPKEEKAQIARGERVMKVIQGEAEGAQVIAEDLGVIPPWARKALDALGIPGYKVIPWERDYEKHVYRVPSEFTKVSVVSWSTHDTAPINAWWKDLQPYEKEGLSQMIGAPEDADDDARWRALMKTLMEAGSDLALVLAPEILGEDRRINTPGTVGPENWTYRLPLPIEELEAHPVICERMATLRALAAAGKR